MSNVESKKSRKSYNYENNLDIAIRCRRPRDFTTVQKITYEAFLTLNYPGRRRMDEHYLVRLLRNSDSVIPELCFVAEYKREIVGHILYTKSGFRRPDGSEADTVTFGPLAVLPRHQRRGVGAALVRHSLEKAREMGYKAVLITGVPDYYPKLGFRRASEYSLFLEDNNTGLHAVGPTMDAFMAYELEPGYLSGGGVFNHWAPEFDKAENEDKKFNYFHWQFMAAYSGSLILRSLCDADKAMMEDFLYNALFLPPGAAPPPHEVVFEPDLHIYIKDFGSQKGDHGIVAEKNHEVLGMAWTRIIPGYGHIDDETPELAISVLPEYRGQGVGERLLGALFRLLREQGYKQTSLSVQKANPAARLYRRIGYETIRDNEDDYIKVKDLRVDLRVWKTEDAAALAAAINDKNILDNSWDGIRSPYKKKDEGEFLDSLTKGKVLQYVFAITYDGKAIGNIGAFGETGALGYYIAEPYWGKGIMAEAIRQMRDYLFTNTKIGYISAAPYEHNLASRRALEKAGFKHEATLHPVRNKKSYNVTVYTSVEEGYFS